MINGKEFDITSEDKSFITPLGFILHEYANFGFILRRAELKEYFFYKYTIYTDIT